jgi:hypothetical protein
MLDKLCMVTWRMNVGFTSSGLLLFLVYVADAISDFSDKDSSSNGVIR